jgi:hypothetical protein
LRYLLIIIQLLLTIFASGQNIVLDHKKISKYITKEPFYFDDKRNGITSSKPYIDSRYIVLFFDSINIDTLKNQISISGKLYDRIFDMDSMPLLIPIKLYYGNYVEVKNRKIKFRKKKLLASYNQSNVDPAGPCSFNCKFSYNANYTLFFISPAYILTSVNLSKLWKEAIKK